MSEFVCLPDRFSKKVFPCSFKGNWSYFLFGKKLSNRFVYDVAVKSETSSLALAVKTVA